ncbi:MAG: hypothetical protein Q4D31_05360 [Eubacteriales bacterium]|nr:hypothetical protein [Eubacteriales bacterium]
MFCRSQAIGLAVCCLGIGLLFGGLLPSCLLIWLLSFALIVVGVLLFRC